MSPKPSSTLGYERRHNPRLQYAGFEDFALAMSQDFPARPKSFSHIIATNAGGAPLLERCPLEQALSVEDFERRMAAGAVIIDARDGASFGGCHIPGALNIGFEKQLANWVGMVVDPAADILLVVNDRAAFEAMRTELQRIGYDRILGYLAGGMQAWIFSGRPAERLERLQMPGLTLYGTERTPEGLFGLRRLGLPETSGAVGAPGVEELCGVFWRAFFLWRLSGAGAGPVRAAWEALCAAYPRLCASLRRSLPALGGHAARLAADLAGGLAAGGRSAPRSLLAGTAPFWRPLAGYMEAALENEDASDEALGRCLQHLAALAEIL